MQQKQPLGIGLVHIESNFAFKTRKHFQTAGYSHVDVRPSVLVAVRPSALVTVKLIIIKIIIIIIIIKK